MCCSRAYRSAASCCHGWKATRCPRRVCACQARPDDASGRCGRRASALPTASQPTDGHCVQAGNAQCWRRRRRRRSVVIWRHCAGRVVRRPRPQRCGLGRKACRSRRRDRRCGHRWRGCGRRKHPEQAAPARPSVAAAAKVGSPETGELGHWRYHWPANVD